MMVNSKSTKSSPQHARFLEAAREAGADAETSAADALMGKLAKTKPEPKPAKKIKPDANR